MCIAFWTLDHPDYALILAANRDEVLHRPTMPAHWHAFEPISSPSHSPDSLASSRPYVLAGRDAVAGGTWLGINRSGHVAVITNIQEEFHSWHHSRGDLTRMFLLDESTPLKEYATKLADIHQADAGFNLLLFAPSSLSTGGQPGTLAMDAELVTNHGGGGQVTHRPLTRAERACAGVSNGLDGSPCWPKVLSGTEQLQALLSRAPETVPTSRTEQECALVNGLLNILSREAVESISDPADLSTTIQVPLITLTSVPSLVSKTNKDCAILAERHVTMYYGTRLASILLVRRDTGEVMFLERDVYELPKEGEDGRPKNLSHGRAWESGNDAGGHDRVFRFTIQQDAV